MINLQSKKKPIIVKFHFILRHFFILYSSCFILNSAFSQGPKQWEKIGDKSFADGDYFGASLYYKNALKFDSTNLKLTYKYGESLRSYHEYKKGEEAYQYVYNHDRGVNFPEALFWLATMQKYNGRYSEAQYHYRKFAKIYLDKTSYFVRKAKREISACEVAKKLVLDSVDVAVKNIGDLLNTSHSEFSPIMVNDSIMYFSSMRTDRVSGDFIIVDTADYYLKIYKARKIGNFWEADGELPILINNPAFHAANGTLSPDKKHFYFSRCTHDFKCAIYMSEEKKGQWMNPVILDKNINMAGYTSTQPHVALVEGKEVLFFVSDRPRGRGKLDIWYSTISGKGKRYSNPKNLGPKINSLDSEISPFYDEKSKTLYFSSDWHYGLGGFDIFKSTGSLRSLSQPENMKPPYNSSVNDFYFSIDSEKERGFFTSNREGSITVKGATCCNDIYAFGNEDSVEVIPVTEEEQKIISLEALNKYLPVTLYFHNDEPHPRSWDTTASITYMKSYQDYTAMIGNYKKKYSSDMAGEDSVNAVEDIESFFFDYADKGVQDLELFTELLLKELEKGQKIALKIKGYASPLAKTDYNVNLTLRRISSMMNYMKAYNDGVYVPYLNKTADNEGSLEFIKIPFGEYKANTTVSDNWHDQRNSVYSRKAALERKIEIISVSQSDKDSVYAEISFENEIHDFGYVKPGKKLIHVFSFTNTGKEDLIISNVKSSCGCTVPLWPKEAIKPNKKAEITVVFDTRGKIGKQVKSVTLYTNANPETKVLTVTSEIVKD